MRRLSVLALILCACEATPSGPAGDPGFADEVKEVGWNPVELASPDVSPPGEGDAVFARALASGSDAVPGIARDRFGGVGGTGLATTRTGYFHLEKPAGGSRTWLVDPDGNPFFGVGLNTVLRSANVPEIERYLRRLPHFADVARVEWDRLTTGAAGGFGYFFNSTPGFADTNDLQPALPSPITTVAPYGVLLGVGVATDAPYAMRSAGGKVLGEDDATQTLGDPYNPAYRAMLMQRWSAKVRPADPLLMVYWLDNEIGLFDHPLHFQPGQRDLRTWMWSECPVGSSIDAPACARHALAAFLRDRYGDVSKLNAAWQRGFGSWQAVLDARPTPGSDDSLRRCDGECEQDLMRFCRQLWRQWVKMWSQLVRELDPNHLVSSPRMAVANSDSYCFWGIDGCIATFTDGRRVKQGDGVTYSPFSLFQRNGPYGFDLIAVNIYSRPDHRGFERPWVTQGFHEMVNESHLPIFVSEFGVRARIDGWSNSGGAGSFVPRDTAGQEQALRGEFYSYDVLQLAGFRSVVGVSFHRWADRYLPDEQMNMGIVHRNGDRWDGFDAAIRHTNSGIYSRLHALTGW